MIGNVGKAPCPLFCETVCMNEEIVLVDKLDQFMEKRIRLENAHIVGFCIKGKGTFNFDNKRIQVSSDDMIICPPNVIMESGLVSADFESRLFIISSRLLGKVSFQPSSGNWGMISNRFVWPLPKEKARIFLLYYELIKAHLAESGGNRYRKEVFSFLFQAFARDLFGFLLQLIPDTCGERQGHYLFSNFLMMLSVTYPRERKISYYANQLNTSPKYLSCVCKQQCGKTALEIINYFVVRDIVALLRDSRKSVKEIANELDFPNMSFFGTYVRHHLGVSPKAYRQRLAYEEDGPACETDIDFGRIIEIKKE